MTLNVTPDALDSLRADAGRTLRSAFAAAGLPTWRKEDDVRAGKAVSAGQYVRIAEAMEDAHLALGSIEYLGGES